MKLYPSSRVEWRRAAIRVVVILSVLAGAVLAFATYCASMPGASFSGRSTPLNATETQLRKRLEGHVVHLAQTIGVRHTRRPKKLRAAATYIETQLRRVGYKTSRQTFGVGSVDVANIEAAKAGTELAEERIVVGAHYDTDSFTPGADDNASGVAAMLELARLLRTSKLKRTVHFVGFPNEEPPFFRTTDMGSYRYAKRARARGWTIRAMFSLESIGYFDDKPGSQKYPPPFSLLYPNRGNFIAFIGNLASRGLTRRVVGRFRQLAQVPSEGIAAPAWVNGVDFSDHLNFWKFDFPALMVTDTAPFRNPHYHEGTDKPGTLDYDRLTRITVALAEVIKTLANKP